MTREALLELATRAAAESGDDAVDFDAVNEVADLDLYDLANLCRLAIGAEVKTLKEE